MDKEVHNKISEALEQKSKYYFATYAEDSECEDDCFIHIVRNKFRYVFYNGQERGHFTNKDIPRFAKMVDDVIQKGKGVLIKFKFKKGQAEKLGAIVEAMMIGERYAKGLINDDIRKQLLNDLYKKYKIIAEVE